MIYELSDHSEIAQTSPFHSMNFSIHSIIATCSKNRWTRRASILMTIFVSNQRIVRRIIVVSVFRTPSSLLISSTDLFTSEMLAPLIMAAMSKGPVVS